jgi:hypothetical protein
LELGDAASSGSLGNGVTAEEPTERFPPGRVPMIAPLVLSRGKTGFAIAAWLEIKLGPW